jgi:hypothetical protein
MSVLKAAEKVVFLSGIAERNGGWQRRNALLIRRLGRHGTVLAFIHQSSTGFWRRNYVQEIIGTHATGPFTDAALPPGLVELKENERLLCTEPPGNNRVFYRYTVVPPKLGERLARKIEGSEASGKPKYFKPKVSRLVEPEKSQMYLCAERFLNRLKRWL